MPFENRSKADLKKKERRQAEIWDRLQSVHYVSIEEITQTYGVTTQTARRDMMALEERRLVRRLHGGAALAAPLDPDTYRQRRTAHTSEKARIAEIVASLITDGQTIFLDAGTTCEAIAQELLKKPDLRIVTYSLRIAALLSEHSQFTVAIPGGFVRPVDGGVFQEDTPDFVRRFKFDHAVISVSGLSAAGELCDDDHTEVAVASAAIEQAANRILAVDSSKFDKSALVRLGTLSQMSDFVTDSVLPPAFARAAKDAGVRVHLPKMSG